jgi:hypothetical protein
MLHKRLIIDVQGSTSEEIAAAIKAAGAALTTSTTPEDECGVGFSTMLAVEEPSGLSPNTLYVVGTNAAGDVVIRGTRSSSDAARDQHIMEAALELSQAVELRGVQFDEHKLGGLLVRPVPKEAPLRDVVQEYVLSHITDLAKLDDEDIPHFVRTLPGLIAMLKIAADDDTATGVNLATIMPVVRYVADDSLNVSVRNDAASIETTTDALQAGWERKKLAADCPKSETGQHHVVRDDDAPQHGCCQNCDKVVHLG